MVKWGVLGTASIARGCTIPGMKKAKNCDLYAIAGRNPEKAEKFKSDFGFKKAYYDYDSLLADKDIQAVYIPLPNNIHREWVLKALKAGKNVLCEKPLALNAAEAEEMFETARANNVILAEAYAYLQSEFMNCLVNDIKNGVIGDVVYIDTAFVTQGYKEDFRLHKELGGGMIYDLGCYCTTMLLSLVDSETEYVKACAEMTDEGVDAFVGALIKFKNGVRASFNVGMILGENSNARFDRLYIHGTKGDIRSEYRYNASGSLSYTIFKNGTSEIKNIETSDNYMLETEKLGECIEKGTAPLVTPEFSVKNSKLLDELLKEAGY